MRIPFRIIDGYNLMHAAGFARQRYGPGDLERCRNRFLKRLAAVLNEAERQRTTVVFDARDPHIDGPRETTLDGIRIVFAHHSSDADEAIETLIRQHSAPRQIELISTDRRLQTAARRRRGTAIDSEAFARRIEAAATPLRAESDDSSDESDSPEPEEISESEREHWLKVFGDIPDVKSSEVRRDPGSRPRRPRGNGPG